MSTWEQTLIVGAVTIVVVGFFQYRRRQGDVVEVGREMLRPTFLLILALIMVVFFVLRVVSDFIGRVL